jgi:hypothetical protein
MHTQYPSVYPLAVHLENEQNVFFEDDDTIEDTIHISKKTTLTEWLNNKKECSDGRHLMYSDYCDMFVWNKNDKNWSKRKNNTAIGRMVFVSPTEGDIIYVCY